MAGESRGRDGGALTPFSPPPARGGLRRRDPRGSLGSWGRKAGGAGDDGCARPGVSMRWMSIGWVWYRGGGAGGPGTPALHPTFGNKGKPKEGSGERRRRAKNKSISSGKGKGGGRKQLARTQRPGPGTQPKQELKSKPYSSGLSSGSRGREDGEGGREKCIFHQPVYNL